MADVTPLALTLKCPIGGEEWPSTSYKCIVRTINNRKVHSEVVQKRDLVFHCPADHFFSLACAERAGMFDKSQIERILAAASALRRQDEERRKQQ